MRWWTGLIVAMVASVATHPAASHAQGVAVPAVAVHAGAGGAGPGRALPRLVEQELSSLLGVQLAPRGRAAFLLRPSVTRVERGRQAGEAAVRCQVSVIVEDRAGAVRLVLSGSARAVGGRSFRDLEERALAGAIRSALRPLGVALRSRHS